MGWNTTIFLVRKNRGDAATLAAIHGAHGLADLATAPPLDFESAASPELAPRMAAGSVNGWGVLFDPACDPWRVEGRTRELSRDGAACGLFFSGIGSLYGFVWCARGEVVRTAFYRDHEPVRMSGEPLAEESDIPLPSWGHDEDFLLTVARRLTGVDMAALEDASYRLVNAPSRVDHAVDDEAMDDETGDPDAIDDVKKEPHDVPAASRDLGVDPSREQISVGTGPAASSGWRWSRLLVPGILAFVVVILVAGGVIVNRLSRTGGVRSRNLRAIATTMLTPQEETLRRALGFQEVAISTTRRYARSLRFYESMGTRDSTLPPALEVLTLTDAAYPLLMDLREQLAPFGYGAFMTSSGNDFGRIVVVKGTEQFRFLRYSGLTMQGESGAEVVERLRAWDAEFGIDITGAGFDWVMAQFRRPPSDMGEIAREVWRLSPDLPELGYESVERLERDITAHNGVLIMLPRHRTSTAPRGV